MNVESIQDETTTTSTSTTITTATTTTTTSINNELNNSDNQNSSYQNNEISPTSSTTTNTTNNDNTNTTINNNNNSNNNNNILNSSSSKIINSSNNLKLWIGNLPISTTEKEIREYFSEFKIDLIKMTEISESQLACAIVQFFDHESASLARENGLSSTFKGNKLIIDWSNSPSTLSPNLNSNLSSSSTSTSTYNSSSSSSNSSISSSSNKESHYHPYPTYQQPQHHHSHHRTVYYNNQPLPSTIATNNVNISPPKPPKLPASYSSSSSSSSSTTEVKERITDSDPRVNRKLFLGLTYEGETIEDLRNRFGKYGKVEEVLIYASGLAFLRFYNTESAILAKRDLGYRYKIQYDKKEPRDLQYYDPNGPSSFYDRSSIPLDSFEYGNTKLTIPSQQPPIPSSQQQHPSSSSSSDYYSRDLYRDSHNKNSYYSNERPPPPQQQPLPLSIPPQQQPIPSQISAAFSEPLSNDEYNQFYSFLENLKSTNSSIKESKDWFILHLKSGNPIVQLINRYITNTNSPVYNKIEVIYLINDILYFGLVRRLNPDTKDPISELFESFLPSIFSSFHNESQSNQNNCLKVLDFWEEKHYYSHQAIQAFRNHIFK